MTRATYRPRSFQGVGVGFKSVGGGFEGSGDVGWRLLDFRVDSGRTLRRHTPTSGDVTTQGEACGPVTLELFHRSLSLCLGPLP